MHPAGVIHFEKPLKQHIEEYMRCSCCNVILSASESTRKFKNSGAYVDMCNKCLSTISDEVSTVDSGVEDEDEDQDQ